MGGVRAGNPSALMFAQCPMTPGASQMRRRFSTRRSANANKSAEPTAGASQMRRRCANNGGNLNARCLNGGNLRTALAPHGTGSATHWLPHAPCPIPYSSSPYGSSSSDSISLDKYIFDTSPLEPFIPLPDGTPSLPTVTKSICWR